MFYLLRPDDPPEEPLEELPELLEEPEERETEEELDERTEDELLAGALWLLRVEEELLRLLL